MSCGVCHDGVSSEKYLNGRPEIQFPDTPERAGPSAFALTRRVSKFCLYITEIRLGQSALNGRESGKFMIVILKSHLFEEGHVRRGKNIPKKDHVDIESRPDQNESQTFKFDTEINDQGHKKYRDQRLTPYHKL